MLGKTGYRVFECVFMKTHVATIEDHGHQGKLITMLLDAGENIDWRAIDETEPNEPLVRVSEMPPHGIKESGTIIVGYSACLGGMHSMTRRDVQFTLRYVILYFYSSLFKFLPSGLIY